MHGVVKKIFLNLVNNGSISASSLIGCSNAEIEIVEKHFECILPQAYREFLEVAGYGAGKLFRGTHIFYPDVLMLQSEAIILFAEANMLEVMPENAIVFCMHQGYEVEFLLPNSDDPEIYQYVEGKREITKPWSSFSEFLQQSINNHLRQWPDLN